MYDKLLKGMEGRLDLYIQEGNNKYDSQISNVLDCIIKIKTIQAMDVSAGLIEASKKAQQANAKLIEASRRISNN